MNTETQPKLSWCNMKKFFLLIILVKSSLFQPDALPCSQCEIFFFNSEDDLKRLISLIGHNWHLNNLYVLIKILMMSFLLPPSELCCSDGWWFWREGWRRTDGCDARTNGERAMMRPAATPMLFFFLRSDAYESIRMLQFWRGQELRQTVFPPEDLG